MPLNHNHTQGCVECARLVHLDPCSGFKMMHTLIAIAESSFDQEQEQYIAITCL